MHISMYRIYFIPFRFRFVISGPCELRKRGRERGEVMHSCNSVVTIFICFGFLFCFYFHFSHKQTLTHSSRLEHTRKREIDVARDTD